MSVPDDILRAEPRSVGLLADSDRETWERLIQGLDSTDVCPLVLVRTLLAIDDPQRWRARVYKTFAGLNPDIGMGADYDFLRWFTAGIAAHLPGTDPAVLELAFRVALDDVAAGTAARAHALTVTIEAAGDSAPHRSVLGRTLMIVARRLTEDGDDAGAMAAAVRARDIFTELGDARWVAFATRVHAGALLRLRKVDEALVLIDALFEAPTAWLDGTHRPITRSDPIDAALSNAATILLTTGKEAPEWNAALATIAERLGHRGCADRVHEPQRTDDFDPWNQKDRII